MVHYTCDMCGKPLLVDEDTRYVVKIEVFAAYDVMELSEDDLEHDHLEEISDLVEEMEGMDPEELEEGVYKAFRYDLCPSCQKLYLRDPLSRKANPRIGLSEN